MAMHRSSFLPLPFPVRPRRFVRRSFSLPRSTKRYDFSCPQTSSFAPGVLEMKFELKCTFSARRNCCNAKPILSLLSKDVTTPTRFLPVLSPEKCLIGGQALQIAATRDALRKRPYVNKRRKRMFINRRAPDPAAVILLDNGNKIYRFLKCGKAGNIFFNRSVFLYSMENQ